MSFVCVQAMDLGTGFECDLRRDEENLAKLLDGTAWWKTLMFTSQWRTSFLFQAVPHNKPANRSGVCGNVFGLC